MNNISYSNKIKKNIFLFLFLLLTIPILNDLFKYKLFMKNCYSRKNEIASINNFKDIYDSNSFEFYYSNFLCSLLFLDNEKNCLNEVLTNYNFFYSVKFVKSNITLCININKTLLENILLIIAIIPFLKNNSTIIYDIGNNNSKQLYNKLFKYKKIFHRKIIIDIYDLEIIKNAFNILINYNWEIFPPKQILDNIRYIINNYYDELSSNIFDISLNKNYEYFIQNHITNNSHKTFEQLLSKSS